MTTSDSSGRGLQQNTTNQDFDVFIIISCGFIGFLDSPVFATRQNKKLSIGNRRQYSIQKSLSADDDMLQTVQQQSGSVVLRCAQFLTKLGTAADDTTATATVN